LDAGTGQLLGGRFQLKRMLGEGSMGVVYQARDRRLDDDVALKLLKPIGGQRLVMFKREFRALQGIHHVNLVGLRELLEDDGRYFFTMELVHGKGFLEYVSGEPAGAEPVPCTDAGAQRRLRAALVALADGLAALHGAGKVHRDVKPGNVLVTPEGRVVIVDFGLIAERDVETAGVAVGTPNYMAPEQACGREVGPPADWYAVGAMLFRALTGQLPFAGETEQVMWSKANRVAPRADDICRGLPRDLVELCAALLAREPDRRAGAQAIRAASAEVVTSAAVPRAEPKPARPIFVGRERELELLEEARRATRRGAAVSVLVEGVSGMGKSTLLGEFVARVRARGEGTVVLAGRCYERESVPFKGVDGVFDALAQHLAGLDLAERLALLGDDDADDAGQLFPALVDQASRRPARALAAGAEAQRSRERAFWALRRVLARLAARGLVICIDDFQWTDGDSIALLQLLLSPPAPPPLLLLATVRSDSTGAHAAALPGDVRRLVLESLEAGDARALARRVAADLGDAVCERIATQARGHPLFIDALARHAASHARDDEPARLEDALWARALGCSERARRRLRLLAVARGPIALGVAAAALELTLAEIGADLAQLRAAQLALASGALASDRLEPYHDRVQAAVRAHLDDAAARDLHARLAAALARHGADAEAVAHHCLGAEQHARARELFAHAAAQASRALAFDRAVRLYRQTLALGGSAAERATWLAALGDALANAGRGEEAARAYLEAAPAVDPAAALALQKRAAETLLVSGCADEGTRVLDGLLRQLGAAPRRTRLATLVSLGLRRLWIRLRGLGYAERDPAAIEPAALLRADVLWIGALGLGMVDTVRGAEMQARYLLEALRLGDHFRLMRAFTAEALYVASRGDLAAAERLLRSSGSVAERLRRPNARHAVLATLGVAAYICGHWQRALDGLSPFPGFVASDMTSETWWLHDQVDIMTCGTRFFLGRFAEYRNSARRILTEATRAGRSYLVDNIESGIGISLPLGDDDVAAAEAMIAAKARRCPSGTSMMHIILLYAEVYRDLYVGDAPSAYAHLCERTPAMRRALLTRVFYFRMMLDELRGRAAVALAAGDGRRRSALLREAERLAARLAAQRTATSDAFAANLRAHVAELRGRGDACERLAAARDAFDRADMSLHAAAVTRRLGAAAADPALVAAADARARDEGIKAPERFFRMLA
jgi:hypothetical protein